MEVPNLVTCVTRFGKTLRNEFFLKIEFDVWLISSRVSDQSSDTVEIRTPLLEKRNMLSTSILRQYMHPPTRYFDPASELPALRGVVFTPN